MMRVILRPAALLIDPFSSARLLFFPLPAAAEMGQGRGGNPKTQVCLPQAFPEALSTTAADVDGSGHLAQVSREVRTCSALRACGKAPPSSWHPLPDPPQAPTVFAGLSAAEGGTAVTHAEAVGV